MFYYLSEPWFRATRSIYEKKKLIEMVKMAMDKMV